MLEELFAMITCDENQGIIISALRSKRVQYLSEQTVDKVQRVAVPIFDQHQFVGTNVEIEVIIPLPSYWLKRRGKILWPIIIVMSGVEEDEEHPSATLFPGLLQ